MSIKIETRSTGVVATIIDREVSVEGFFANLPLSDLVDHLCVKASYDDPDFARRLVEEIRAKRIQPSPQACDSIRIAAGEVPRAPLDEDLDEDDD